MLTSEKKVGASPLPVVTPPRLSSPSKTRLKESMSQQSQPTSLEEEQTIEISDLDTPRKTEDMELQEKDNKVRQTFSPVSSKL